jgi:MFS family permease
MNMNKYCTPSSSLWPSRKLLIVTTVVVCLLADAFAYGMTLPVLPSLFTRIGVAETDFQVLSSTIVSVHAGSSMLFFPVAGLIVHRTKTRKSPMLTGLIVFSIVSELPPRENGRPFVYTVEPAYKDMLWSSDLISMIRALLGVSHYLRRKNAPCGNYYLIVMFYF